MAATMKLQKTGKVLPFRQPCPSVNRTDSKSRLPKITSAEIETIFDQVSNKTLSRRAA